MIRMRELYRLENIRNLRLIAGEAGLERTVTAAVLFEYDPSRMQLPDFYRGDLVVTTLAYARSDSQLVAQSLLALMNQGVAGLLVKTAYFKELPQAVVDMANRQGTPLFLFDETYIEEVILEVTELIRGRRHFAGFEKEIDALMQGGLTDEQIREKVARIDPAAAGAYRVAALYPQSRMPGLDDKLYALLTTDAHASQRYMVMEWRRMLLVLCRMGSGAAELDGAQEMDELLDAAQIDRESVLVGVSSARETYGAFGAALCEAVYAAKAAKLTGRRVMPAGEMGLYGWLFPMSENAFICDQCRRSLAAIREYDEQNRTNLEYTAKVYVDEGMEIAAAARALFQHPNTVRYRLGKIKKLMGMESDSLFMPMISMLVNLSRILEDDGL